MKGWLVVNKFMNTENFSKLYEQLQESAKRKNVELIKYNNAELCLPYDKLKLKVDNENPEFCLFWDKDIMLAKQLERCGLRLFNSSSAIEICDNKALTYVSLIGKNIDMPKTMILPKIFYETQWQSEDVIDNVICELGLPLVMKEVYGSFGEQVYLIKTKQQLIKKLADVGTSSVLFQEFVETSFARDVRIYVVGGKVVASMLRFSDTGDFRTNITTGGKMRNYTPTSQECDLAIRTCNALGLDFAGVDILFGKDNKPVLCEVNSNAHFLNIVKCTGVSISDCILEHVVCSINKSKNAI